MLLKLDVDNNRIINIYAGINEDASYYTLDPKSTFCNTGVCHDLQYNGQRRVSRNFTGGHECISLVMQTLIGIFLLNSWEGVYF